MGQGWWRCNGVFKDVNLDLCVFVPVQISAEDYTAAQPDPVAQFSKPVCGHMNEDHASAIAAIIQHCAGISVRLNASYTCSMLCTVCNSLTGKRSRLV